ncbi:type IV secretion system DNA-binding domain-containing protein [Candidatus Spongiihabitans sp.]|uniref:type IV secretion system DNA-binding domain-containing protein n=1 Tax=Candidatus Spongiihabitans sp. TaxID=3101308 RepID=UPI003C7E6C5E
MSTSLIDNTIRFYPDNDTDALNDEFMTRLGMPHRYQPARLAIARSLAISTSPPGIGAKSSRIIMGDTLFGHHEYLSMWIALIVEHAGDAEIDKSKLGELVSAHWRRGIKLLDDEWNKSEKDVSKFVKRLVDGAEIPRNLPSTNIGRSGGAQTDVSGSFSRGQITVPIGEVSEEVTTKQKIKWDLNGAGGSPHSAIMGGVGSGKTRTAVAMLRSIREQAPSVPLIAFDFKGDLGGVNSTYQLDELFDARTISPPREPVPLDVLSLSSTEEIDITHAAYRFREAFANLKGSRLGDRQRDAIYEAARQALNAQSPCELQHILDALVGVYEEKEMKEDGAVSTMRELCRLPLFNPELDLASFFQQSWLINLPQDVPADSSRIVVNLVLNALDRHLNSLSDSSVDDGARSLRIMCMVDEAHQILRNKLPALSNLIRMSRSKGGAIMLISQSPDDFSGAEDEFLNEMGLVAAFSTNASPGNVKRILGQGTNLSTLQIGQCFVKLRENPRSAKIQSWLK